MPYSIPFNKAASSRPPALLPVHPRDHRAVPHFDLAVHDYGCSNYNSSDNLVITINRGFVAATSTTQLDVVGTVVTVSFPYDWRFYSVIQQILPGVIKTSPIVESATVHNQM